MVTKLRLVITSTYFSINWSIYICLMYRTWGCNFYWPCFLYSSSLVFVGVFLLCKNVTFSPKTFSLSICIHHHIILFIKSPNIFAHIFIDTPALFQDLDVLHGYAVVKNTYFNSGYIKIYIEISWGVYIFGWNKDSLLFNGNRTTFWDI